MVLLAAT